MDLQLHDELERDIRALPDEPARRAAFQAMADLRTGRRTGVPLDYRASTGDLRDCRKLYFDVNGSGAKPRFRMVYRELETNRIEVVTAEVIAIGLRANVAAYIAAARRLGRLPVR